jgi:hypothetical protein
VAQKAKNKLKAGLQSAKSSERKVDEDRLLKLS